MRTFTNEWLYDDNMKKFRNSLSSGQTTNSIEKDKPIILKTIMEQLNSSHNIETIARGGAVCY